MGALFSQQEIEEAVRKTVARYNRFRSPEAIAKPVKVLPGNVTIAFTGAFCTGCGVLGYVEGFVHDFEALNSKVKLKIGKTREISTRSIEVDYEVRNKV